MLIKLFAVVAKLVLPIFGRASSATTILFLFFSACGSPYLITVPSLSAQQPKVVSVLPKDKDVTSPAASVSATLSAGVDEATVGKYSFLIVEDYVERSPETLKDELKDEKLLGIEGDYKVSEDGTCITFLPKDGLKPLVTYGVILTPEIKTKNYLPLTKVFVSQFTVSDSEAAVEGAGQSTENQNKPSDQIDTGDIASDASGQQEEIPPPDVVLNEIFYDSADSDTDGNLFIELKGTPGGKISGYKIVMVNGDDGKVTATVTLPTSALISEEGLYVVADAKTNDPKATNVANYDVIANFDPQNGPDSVQLVDSKGGLVDAVCYGATSSTVADNKLAMCEGSAGPDASAGSSISRQPDSEDTNDNATDFVVNTVPSAGNEDVTIE